MTEPQPMPRVHYQPPRERLALLLEQLSELDPEGDKKLKFEAVVDRAPEKKLKFEAAPAAKLKLAPVPIRKPDAQAVEQKAVKAATTPRVKPAPKSASMPAKKAAPKTAPVVARKPVAKTKATPQARVKAVPRAKTKKAIQSTAERNSFQSILRNCEREQALRNQRAQKKAPPPESAISPWLALSQKGLLGSLLRGWSWLNSKYKNSAAKRLRLSEVVSLGDKRFVALIKVEDREFLIGGASSGLSLLSPLEAAGGTEAMRKRGIGSGGKAR
jgi:hypothetical protein